jgi:hypothetical protein
MSEIDQPPSGPPRGSPATSLTALSPAEAALVRYLAGNGGEADSRAVRRDLTVANISETARSATRKLALAGDARRIECMTGSTVDPVTGRLRPAARWRLIAPTTLVA